MDEDKVTRQQQNCIVADKLTKTYGKGRTRVTALMNVNLTIKSGEFVAVLGPSGSGKTTLLNMLGALDRPTEGQVIIDGSETSSIPERNLYQIRREKLGFVFQSYHLVPTLSAMQNVLMPVLPLKGNGRYRERAQNLLELMGLKDRMHHKPAELSGGEQQRVSIARSLILDPSIILADEPTGNLDAKTGSEIIELMLRLNQEHAKTLLFVTHDHRLAEKAQRSVFLYDGKLSETRPEVF